METGLKNSVVLVTGGAGGIGETICRAFASDTYCKQPACPWYEIMVRVPRLHKCESVIADICMDRS